MFYYVLYVGDKGYIRVEVNSWVFLLEVYIFVNIVVLNVR